MLPDQRKERVKSATYAFILHGFNETYDTFLDFLTLEDHWSPALPDYFHCLYSENRAKCKLQLVKFLADVLDEDMADEIQEYEPDIRMEIAKFNDMEFAPIFASFDHVRSLRGDDRMIAEYQFAHTQF